MPTASFPCRGFGEHSTTKWRCLIELPDAVIRGELCFLHSSKKTAAAAQDRSIITLRMKDTKDMSLECVHILKVYHKIRTRGVSVYQSTNQTIDPMSL